MAIYCHGRQTVWAKSSRARKKHQLYVKGESVCMCQDKTQVSGDQQHKALPAEMETPLSSAGLPKLFLSEAAPPSTC
jgi:hypothetical protein